MTKELSKTPITGRMLVHVLLAIYALILGYIVLSLVLRFSVSGDIFFGLSFALLFFTIGQSIYELGLKNAMGFLLIASAIGYLAEVLGTSSGFPFGKYFYTDLLGEKILGVPIVVPLVWFVISYLSFSIARTAFPDLMEGKVTRNSMIVKLTFLSAFGAVAWDFMIDPMFSSYRYWVWTGQFVPLPELDGIPLTNFLGWFVLVSLMVYISCKVLFRKSSGMIIYRRNALDSKIAYSLLILDGVVANYSLENFLAIGIGLVTMISFLTLAYWRSTKRLAMSRISPMVG
ncbi:MAG: carotenoid biosynthesis protein [Thaumarchaeota archaeon]|nr:carotenoid biosynthesis protein [Nitrososphaerota archaeon]